MGNQYVVICQANSLARFLQGYSMVINVSTLSGKIEAEFQTFYESIDGGVIPRNLHVKIQGTASSVDEASNNFWNGANQLIPLIAFSANAYVEDLVFELAFDNTPKLLERDFLQSFLTAPRELPDIGRSIDIDTTIRLIEAVSKHPEIAYIRRAIEQYRQALFYWRPGTETYAISHLFMSSEALKLGMCNYYLRSTGLPENDVAQAWGIPIKRKNGQMLPQKSIRNEIEARIRRYFIFQGDDTRLHEAKFASDAFEHGSEDFSVIFKHASQSRNMTAQYLRSAILDFVSLVGVDLNGLLKPLYSEPLERIHARYLRGKLTGNSDTISEEGYDYPWFELNTKLKATKDAIGNDAIVLDQKPIPHLADGITFNGELELWGPKK